MTRISRARSAAQCAAGLPHPENFMLSTAPTGAAASARLFVFLLLAAALVLGLGARFAHAAPPPAGAVIGNQATATYTDSGGVARTATSNLVQTTVQQVYSQTLTASQSKTVAPGGIVYYAHTLTNTGNGVETYNLALADGGTNAAVTFSQGTNLFVYADANGDGVPDNTTPLTSSGAVNAGAQFRFVVAVQWPAVVTSGSEAVTVTSTGAGAPANGSVATSNTDTTSVTGNAVVNVVKSLSVTSGPSPSSGNITVTLTYTNTGAVSATNVTLFDALQPGFNYVVGSGLWSGSGTSLTDAAAGDPAGVSYDWNQTTTGAVTAVIASIGPGQSGTLTFQVTVPAGRPLGPIPNTARYCYNDGVAVVPTGCTTGGAGNIGTQGTPTNTATYTVGQGYSVQLDDSGPAGAAPVSTTDTGTGAVVNNDVVLLNAAAQGSVVSFEAIVSNTGNGADTLNLSFVSNTFPAGTTFTFYNSTNSAVATDSNGDGIPDTGPVAAGTSARVWVRVQLPPNGTSSAAMDSVIRATSVGNASTGDSTTLRLAAITPRTVDLTNNTAGGPGSGFQATGEAAAVTTNTVAPGASTNFQLVIANNGPGADNFDLIATTSNAGIASASPTITLPSGWTVVFRLGTCAAPGATVTNTGNIAASANVSVCATVTVPSNAAAATTDIYFRAASPSSASFSNTAPSQYAAFDVKRDAVTVGSVFNLTLTPNRSGQVFPAGNVLYAHQLCNGGNGALAANTITITFGNGASGFTNALWIDVNGNGVVDAGTDTPVTTGSTYGSVLAAGACVSLLDNVFAPSGAANGTTNVTTITVTHPTAGTGQATDTTTVVSGDLTITKQQRTIACNGTGPGAFTQAALPAQAPGACVQYQIVATNSGAANLSALSVSDATPLYTTLNTTACAVSATRSDAGAVTSGGTATNGTTGTVTASVAGTLPPLVTVTLGFCVQLDQ
jgi:uncharacterized repeat protein (TIGR01451 family)